MINVIVIHNLGNGKYPGENKQVKSGISDDNAFSVFDLPPNLSINPHHIAIPFNVTPACNRLHLKFPSVN